jgi:phosphomannomutase
MKSLIVFDLDGTLAASKSPLDAEMAAHLCCLLDIVKVAVISGGAWAQFERQLLSHLAVGSRLENLSLLPTCGTRFYQLSGTWKCLYSEDIDAGDRAKIIQALNEALDQSGYRAQEHWGDLIEDRGSQITLSGLGQEAPLDKKMAWDPNFEKRKKIKAMLEPVIPGFSIQLGGATSIDIVRPGTKQAGVYSIAVRDPHETKRVIEAIAACLGNEVSSCRTSN